MKIYLDKIEKLIVCESCKAEYIEGGDSQESDYEEVEVGELRDLKACDGGKYYCYACEHDFDPDNVLKDADEDEIQEERDTKKELNSWLNRVRR